jgi:hypothetical protein
MISHAYILELILMDKTIQSRKQLKWLLFVQIRHVEMINFNLVNRFLHNAFCSTSQVRRIQSIVENLDKLKARNANPFSDHNQSVSVTTQWETFENGMGSLSAPPPRVSSDQAVVCTMKLCEISIDI